MSSSVGLAGSDEGEADVLRVICGPTAAGKSELALRLAARHDAAIISADSRQLYRGFDIGTAKPAAAERAAVPHYGVDVADPAERWSAARWAGEAASWIAESRSLGITPLVVGGTGFYIGALDRPLDVAPGLDPGRREALAAVLNELPLDELRRWVAELDPARAHLGRTQLLRAAETVLLSGRRLSDVHTGRGGPSAFAVRYLVVDPGRDLLRERIALRTDSMLAGGWLDEVRTLAATVPRDAVAWKSTGYRCLRDHVDPGEGAATPLEEAREQVIVDTRRYAKRQRTWFRHQLPEGETTRIHPDDPDLDARLDAWWSGDS